MVKVLGVSTILAVSLGMPLSLLPGLGRSLLAQVIPDATLGPESSRLTPKVQIGGELGDLIEGGATRNTVLFHSFSEFNVGDLQRVYFANPIGVESILSRVTGTNVSDIMGTLGVDGNADLFLLNPNGIVFGPNTSLDIAGSFMAMTADGFVFEDGQVFSAVNPEAPPLLTVNVTPGLQWGNSVGDSLGDELGEIRNLGQLVAGESLTLVGDRLHLSGSLTAGQNLILRSDNPVIGDAHFEAGGVFRVERSNGRLGQFTSPNGSVIRAAEDVSFQDYTGASLHIWAGGSVMIPGTITITGAGTLDPSIQETVTLSDGTTVVEVDGNAEPMLDIRAGMRNVGVGTGGEGSAAHIQLGTVRNPGGLVFLSNQYRPNRELSGGTIRVGAIDTSVDQPMNRFAQGGDVIIDARGDIEIKENVTTAARIEITDPEIELPGSGNDIGTFRAFGGDIVLLAGDNIRTQDLDGSAIASITTPETHTLQADGTERVERGSAGAIAQGGSITGATVRRHNEAIRSSTGNIATGDINTSAQAIVNAAADASVTKRGSSTINTDSAGVAIGGNATVLRARGGDVSLSTDVVVGEIRGESDVGNIITDRINASAGAAADVSADASVYMRNDSVENSGNGGVATGGTIGDVVSRGGRINLSSRTIAEDINAATTIGEIQASTMNSSASTNLNSSAHASVFVFADGRAENIGDGGNTSSGELGDVSVRGGAIDIITDVAVGNIRAESDIGVLNSSRMRTTAQVHHNSDTLAVVDTTARGSDLALASNTGDGGRTTGSITGNITSSGGAVATSTHIRTGNIAVASDIGNISLRTIDTTSELRATDPAAASATVTARSEATLEANNHGSGGTALTGQVGNILGQGGDISLATTINTGNISADSDIGQLVTNSMTTSANVAVTVGAEATASTSAVTVPSKPALVLAGNRGNGGQAIGGTVESVRGEGGNIMISSRVFAGEIDSYSDVGSLQTGRLDSSSYVRLDGYANTFASSSVR
ncbi:MAG: filamentous hemagglutinin N-terminal domain-containing protein, partial [Cyanothece sp. SIO2G6]|nr:filamentous hemagglutinin N-terminal domain-containing protein [Cyanothece sp. SIO2G6]